MFCLMVVSLFHRDHCLHKTQNNVCKTAKVSKQVLSLEGFGPMRALASNEANFNESKMSEIRT